MNKAILCIGVDLFDKPDIWPLAGAANDARRWAGFFEHRLGFAARVLTHEDFRAGARVFDVIDELLEIAGQPGDVLGVFVATHGKQVPYPGGGQDQAFLLPHARLASIEGGTLGDGALSLRQLALETARQGLQRFFIIDACRAPVKQPPAGALRDARPSFEAAGQVVYRDVILRRARDAQIDSPLVVINACADRQRAGELRRIRRGIFSTAAEDVAAQRLAAGIALTLNTEFLATVGARMRQLAHEHDDDTLLQDPVIDQGDPLCLWAPVAAAASPVAAGRASAAEAADAAPGPDRVRVLIDRFEQQLQAGRLTNPPWDCCVGTLALLHDAGLGERTLGLLQRQVEQVAPAHTPAVAEPNPPVQPQTQRPVYKPLEQRPAESGLRAGEEADGTTAAELRRQKEVSEREALVRESERSMAAALRDWDLACEVDTADAYKQFIAKWPGHTMVALAKERAERKTLESAGEDRGAPSGRKTVGAFAAQLNRPTSALIEQLQSAGVAKQSPDDALTDGDKERLLEYLRSSHGTASPDRKRIVLTRKSTSEIKQADASGKARTIQLEVRKKRTFVKRDDAPAAVEEVVSAPVVDEQEQAHRDAEAAAQAALIQRQMEDAAERERQAEAMAAAEAAEKAAREAAEKAAAEAAAAREAEAKSASPKAETRTGAESAPAAPVAAEAPAAVVPAPAAVPPAEPPKPGLRVVKAAAADASAKQAQAESDARPKKAENEAAAIREMILRPRQVLTAKKPEESMPPVQSAASAGRLADLPVGTGFQDAPWSPRMVVIPAGRFMMGSPRGEVGRTYYEEPRRVVEIRQRFALGRCVVTFDDYDRYARESNVALPSDQRWGRWRRPVINVSWLDAQGYIRWLNGKLGLAAENEYRLPSEAEWEYAARAGTKAAFWWGERITPEQANFRQGYLDDDDYDYDGILKEKTVDADAFDPNPWGLFGIHGNVFEWVQDCWHHDFSGAPSTDQAWEDGGDQTRRVIRGGAWCYAAASLRSANRDRFSTRESNCAIGFRLARTL